MKKKFVLTGTDNDGFRHRYSVKKLEEFKMAFIKFMVELGFEEDKIKKSFVGGHYNEEDKFIEVELKISEIEDVCWNYKNSKYDIDVFFGRFKIILVIRTKERGLMVEYLETKTDWIKPLEIKKIQEENKEGVAVPLRKASNVSK